ncbi:hypothetical protein [Halalkalibacter hemicellulosilyticus]|uniref:Uncharacterized protein n=1 Tax=Halalkalibacter hemicellulosilyticusJCM 9152 TaxID=1236971 RepID=W4QKB7_9BACI|nr:hypothetical protein [Halalkalibacter hemicellulosilyticus]GAE31794.1 hypothetical protein JCM9152_3284 [Halalkalibacter hemicellulosilyticusJCM 9152]
MKYSEVEVHKLMKAKGLSLEEQIRASILNFIRTIHLNNQNFIETSYRSEFFGDLPMTFQKEQGQVMGLITAKVNGEVRKFVFNDQGYEEIEMLLQLIEEK